MLGRGRRRVPDCPRTTVPHGCRVNGQNAFGSNMPTLEGIGDPGTGLGKIHYNPRFTMSQVETGVESVIERLRQLREDLRNHPDAWQNQTLSDYLEAIEAWLKATK